MTREELDAHLGTRVVVYLEQGPIAFGYLQRSRTLQTKYETLNSASHVEVEAVHAVFSPHEVSRVKPITEALERRLRDLCTCRHNDDPEHMHDWVTCPVHGPSGDDFPNHL